MDSIEFVERLEPYIEASVDYIISLMKKSGLYAGYQHDTFWNALYEEVGQFLLRTYDTYDVAELFEAGETVCWAFGHDFDVAGWSWIRGQEQHTRREEGPIRRALALSQLSIPGFYQMFPRNHWLEIWSGPGSIKLLKHEDEQILILHPVYIEARVELLQRRLNAYYAKVHEDEREVEAENSAGMIVKIRQKTHLDSVTAQPGCHYTCQIEQPRGLIQFHTEKFPSNSLDELILMLCYDFDDFEYFFTRNRFEERIGPIEGQNAVGDWKLVAKAHQEAKQQAISRHREREA